MLTQLDRRFKHQKDFRVALYLYLFKFSFQVGIKRKHSNYRITDSSSLPHSIHLPKKHSWITRPTRTGCYNCWWNMSKRRKFGDEISGNSKARATLTQFGCDICDVALCK